MMALSYLEKIVFPFFNPIRVKAREREERALHQRLDADRLKQISDQHAKVRTTGEQEVKKPGELWKETSTHYVVSRSTTTDAHELQIAKPATTGEHQLDLGQLLTSMKSTTLISGESAIPAYARELLVQLPSKPPRTPEAYGVEDLPTQLITAIVKTHKQKKEAMEPSQPEQAEEQPFGIQWFTDIETPFQTGEFEEAEIILPETDLMHYLAWPALPPYTIYERQQHQSLREAASQALLNHHEHKDHFPSHVEVSRNNFEVMIPIIATFEGWEFGVPLDANDSGCCIYIPWSLNDDLDDNTICCVDR